MQTEQQRAVTRLCIQCGLFLLQHGAESALVDELSSRLGRALGMDSVESSISSNAIVLTTIKDGQCLTSTRKNHDRGINMHVVTEVQHIVILAEHHLLDYKGVEKRFSQIQPLRYPRWLVALMVGLSCACFCKLNKGGWDGAVITFWPVRPRCISASCWHNVIFIHRSTFASPLSPPLPFPDCFCNFPLSAIPPPLRWPPAFCCWCGLSVDKCRRRYV